MAHSAKLSLRTTIGSICVTAIMLMTVCCLAWKASAKPRMAIDRHNPEAVLSAYFAAWGRNDWAAQKSCLSDRFTDMVPEPVEAVSIVQFQRLDGSSPARVAYRVIFDLKVKDQGVSMTTSRYDWTYNLTWNQSRESWLITDYGSG